MSVRVDQRIKGKLNVDIHTCDLCVYTLKITANSKTFTPAQEDLTQKIREAAIEIHLLCWEANNIKVDKNEERYKRRIELEAEAADRCNRLCALIEIAKPLFHLSSKRVKYWTEKTTSVRQEIRAWRESDIKRLKP